MLITVELLSNECLGTEKTQFLRSILVNPKIPCKMIGTKNFLNQILFIHSKCIQITKNVVSKVFNLKINLRKYKFFFVF